MIFGIIFFGGGGLFYLTFMVKTFIQLYKFGTKVGAEPIDILLNSTIGALLWPFLMATYAIDQKGN